MAPANNFFSRFVQTRTESEQRKYSVNEQQNYSSKLFVLTDVVQKSIPGHAPFAAMNTLVEASSGFEY